MLEDLIGVWKTDPDDEESLRDYGQVEMKFCENGDLIYTILIDGIEQKMFMIYEIRDNMIITDQPSAPRQEKTEFILANKRLELNFEGSISRLRWNKYSSCLACLPFVFFV